MALFQSRDPGQAMRSVLRGLVAPVAQAGQLFLAGGRGQFEFGALLFGPAICSLQLVEQRSFFGALGFQPVQFLARGLQALADPGEFGFQLLQQMAGSHGLFFRFAFFSLQAIQQGSEVFNFAAQSQDAHFFVAQRLLQFPQHAQHVAQFALHGKRAFGALLAAGDGDVVEAFARLREEERLRDFPAPARARRWDRERYSRRATWAG